MKIINSSQITQVLEMVPGGNFFQIVLLRENKIDNLNT